MYLKKGTAKNKFTTERLKDVQLTYVAWRCETSELLTILRGVEKSILLPLIIERGDNWQCSTDWFTCRVLLILLSEIDKNIAFKSQNSGASR